MHRSYHHFSILFPCEFKLDHQKRTMLTYSSHIFTVQKPQPICSMVLEYEYQHLLYKFPSHVGKYTSTMEHMGDLLLVGISPGLRPWNLPPARASRPSPAPSRACARPHGADVRRPSFCRCNSSFLGRDGDDVGNNMYHR